MTDLWYPHATRADSPPTPNKYPGANPRPFRGVVLHAEMGSNLGSLGWFRNPVSKAAAHMLNGKDGAFLEDCALTDAPWAQAAGNRMGWISVEHEGFAEALTDAQIANDATLLAWLHLTEGVPLQSTDDPNGHGVGWHGMGGTAWGNHPNCPGPAIKGQRAAIIDQATAIVAYLTHAAATGTAPTAPAPPTLEQVLAQRQEIDVHPTDVTGHLRTEHGEWLQHADGGITTLSDPNDFHGSYPQLLAAGKADKPRMFFAELEARPDGKPGYVLTAADATVLPNGQVAGRYQFP